MTDIEKVLQTVMDAIDELNEQLPKGEKVEKSPDTVLFGSEGSLDSLRLVSLITTIEQKIEETSGVNAALLEEIDLLEGDNPFNTVRSLAAYVTSILEKKGN